MSVMLGLYIFAAIALLIAFKCHLFGHTWNDFVWGSRCNWCDKIKG